MTVRGEADAGAFKVNSLGNLDAADAGSGHLVWGSRALDLEHVIHSRGTGARSPVLPLGPVRSVPAALRLHLVRRPFGRLSPPWVVWGVVCRVAACFTVHWYIAYVAHRRGPQDWIVDDAAVQGCNIGWLAIPTMGESWHSNHHAFPGSCRHGLYKGQIDLGYDFVRLLAWLGLAWNIRTPDNLPARSGLTPVSERALDAVSAGQVALASRPTS